METLFFAPSPQLQEHPRGNCSSDTNGIRICDPGSRGMAIDTCASGRGPGVRAWPESVATEAPDMTGAAFNYRSESRTGQESEPLRNI